MQFARLIVCLMLTIAAVECRSIVKRNAPETESSVAAVALTQAATQAAFIADSSVKMSDDGDVNDETDAPSSSAKASDATVTSSNGTGSTVATSGSASSEVPSTSSNAPTTSDVASSVASSTSNVSSSSSSSSSNSSAAPSSSEVSNASSDVPTVADSVAPDAAEASGEVPVTATINPLAYGAENMQNKAEVGTQDVTDASVDAQMTMAMLVAVLVMGTMN